MNLTGCPHDPTLFLASVTADRGRFELGFPASVRCTSGLVQHTTRTYIRRHMHTYSDTEKFMYKLNKIVSLTAAVGIVLLGASPALARSHINAQSTLNEPVTWTLAPGLCPSLPADLVLSGSGERHKVTNTKANADGSISVLINDLVTGTATDNQGGTYHFKYTNHSIDSISAGGAHQISMVDSFVLNGDGSAKHMNIGFNWSWSYHDPNGPFDVIPLANLVQQSTRGEPLLCDPL